MTFIVRLSYRINYERPSENIHFYERFDKVVEL